MKMFFKKSMYMYERDGRTLLSIIIRCGAGVRSTVGHKKKATFCIEDDERGNHFCSGTNHLQRRLVPSKSKSVLIDEYVLLTIDPGVVGVNGRL